MLAVPLHGNEVAPRFCSADEFMIAEVDGERICHVQRLTIPQEAWPRRLERLSTAGVRILLCGGFNRSFLPVAEGLGMRVISGLAGKADQVIEAFLRDEFEQFRFVPHGIGGGNRGRGWAGRRHGGELRGGKE